MIEINTLKFGLFTSDALLKMLIVQVKDYNAYFEEPYLVLCHQQNSAERLFSIQMIKLFSHTLFINFA